MALLEVKDLHVEIDGREILKGLDLEVQSGEVHAIMGPNGSGKSTLAYVLAGKEEYRPTVGEVRFDGRNLFEMEPDERAAAGLFLAFQYPLEIPGVATMTCLRAPDRSFVVITHYQRLLNYIVPDVVHVLSRGRIVKTGGKELALELEARGYAEYQEEIPA